MKRHEMTLTRALLYHQTARLFVYPDDQLGDLLAAGRTAAAALPDRGRLAQQFAEVEEAWTEAQAGDAGAAGEYTWLFQRNVRCPLHETAYDSDRSVAMAHDLAQVAGFYAAFGVQIADSFRDLPDHLSMELEFVSYLYAKEAYALEQGWKGRANECRAARRQFLREHLARWLPAFAGRAAQHARLRFYPAAAALALALLAGEHVAAEERGEQATAEERDEQAAIAPA